LGDWFFFQTKTTKSSHTPRATMFYGDLYRPVNNVLNTGYVDGHALRVSTKVNPTLKIAVDGQKKTDVSSLFTWEQSTVKYGRNLTTSGSLDLEGDLSLNGKVKSGELVYGGAFTLAADRDSNKNKGKAFTQYAKKGYTLEATVEKKLGVPVTLDAASTFNYEGVTVGANVKCIVYPPQKKAEDILNNYSLGVRYSQGNYHLAAMAENKLKNVKIGFAQDIDPQLTVGVQVEQDLSKPMKNPVFTVGNTYKIDSNSSARAKINNLGELSAAFRIDHSSRVSTTVSATTNVFDRSQPTKTGFFLEFNA